MNKAILEHKLLGLLSFTAHPKDTAERWLGGLPHFWMLREQAIGSYKWIHFTLGKKTVKEVSSL